jgi:hypothetical protein
MSILRIAQATGMWHEPPVFDEDLEITSAFVTFWSQHSPLAAEIAEAVAENGRWTYAFPAHGELVEEIEHDWRFALRGEKYQ